MDHLHETPRRCVEIGPDPVFICEGNV